MPSSDVSRDGVSGTYADIADGTQFVANDETAVRATATNFAARHKTGFSGAPSGNVTRVQVYYGASARSVRGTIQSALYDGDRLVAQGNVNLLNKHDDCSQTGASCGFVDDFTELTASSANNLRVEIRMVNERGAAGSLSYSQMWIHVTLDLNMKWSATVFKGGGATNGFALSPVSDTVLTASADGIFRSTDQGLYYEPRNKHGALSDNRRAATIAYHPNKPGVVYAGTGTGNRGAVLRSSDDGFTWSIVSTVPRFESGEPGLPFPAGEPRSVGNLIAIYGPADTTDTLWVGTFGTNNQGVMRSTNGGSTWTTIGLAGKFSRSLVLHPRNPDLLYVAAYNDGVYVSTDARAAAPTFTKMADAPSRVEELQFVGDTLYAAASTAGLFKLTDGSWTGINGGVPFDGSASWLAITGVRVGESDVLLAGCTPCAPADGYYHSLIRSLNGGSSWEPVTQPERVDMHVLGSGERWILADVVPWDMLGQSDFFTGGLAAEASPDADPSKTVFFASSNTGIFRSTDAGNSWRPSVNGLSNAPSALGPNVDPQDTTRAFFGAGHYGMVLSTDNFTTAQIDLLTDGTVLKDSARTGNPVQFFTAFDTTVTPSKVYVAAGDNQVDLGDVLTKEDVYEPGPWQSLGLNAAFPSKRPAAIVVGHDTSGERVLMVTLHLAGGIARKVGDGPWNLVEDSRLNTTPTPWNGRGATHTHPYMIWVPDIQLVYFFDVAKGLFRSNDGGLTWTLVSSLTSPVARTGGMTVHPQNPATVFLATSTGLYRISNAESGSVLDGTAVQEKIGTFGRTNNVWIDKHGRLFVNCEITPTTPARMEVSWDPLEATPTFDSLVDDYYTNFSMTPDGMAVSDEGAIFLPHRQQGFLLGLPN